ncbi:MAG: MalY/PatB family protein [Candidatus Heimdallarchaeaceae archaeon]
MIYDFDQVIDRTETHSIKWDKSFLQEYFEVSDVLPLWVADMDFQCPQPVIEVIKKKAEEGIYGYSWHGTPEYYDSIIYWMKHRHQWKIEKEWVVYSPGVMPAISVIIRNFTNPGDKIIIQSPVYYPFFSSITKNGRQVVNNQLMFSNKGYSFDFDDFEEKAKDPLTKLFILCSPHNPVGRVWTKAELKKIGEICLENEILVVSDEIHHDLVLSGKKHIVFSQISEEFQENSIICTSPSKTFNLAGLQISNTIIANERIRKNFEYGLSGKNHLSIPNAFGSEALIAAYQEGEEWLNQVLVYIEKNFAYLKSFLEENLSDVEMIKPEGTYLAWLDFKKLAMKDKERKEFLLKKAKVAFNSGVDFGPGGEGFERINVACPRVILSECLKRVNKAIKSEI